MAANSQEIKNIDVRKIIAFNLGGELYGVDICYVNSIMRPRPAMPLPNVPDFILGMINLRGSLLPLIDLRLKFNLDIRPLNEDSRIVVMESKNYRAGLLVDKVWELLRLAPTAFQPAPTDVAKIDQAYFIEVCPVNERMLIVLDIVVLLSDTAIIGEQVG